MWHIFLSNAWTRTESLIIYISAGISRTFRLSCDLFGLIQNTQRAIQTAFQNCLLSLSFWLKVSKKQNYNCMKSCICIQFQREKRVEIWLEGLIQQSICCIVSGLVLLAYFCLKWQSTFGFKNFLHKLKCLWLSCFLLAFLKIKGKGNMRRHIFVWVSYS